VSQRSRRSQDERESVGNRDRGRTLVFSVYQAEPIRSFRTIIAPRSLASGEAARVTAERRLFGPSGSSRNRGQYLLRQLKRGRIRKGADRQRWRLKVASEKKRASRQDERTLCQGGDKVNELTAPTTTTGLPQLTVESMKKAVSSSVSVP
jgi:hypothetical protein